MLPLNRTALVALSSGCLMTWIRIVLMLYFSMVAHKAACQTPSKVFLKSMKTRCRSFWCWRYFSPRILCEKISQATARPIWLSCQKQLVKNIIREHKTKQYIKRTNLVSAKENPLMPIGEQCLTLLFLAGVKFI